MFQNSSPTSKFERSNSTWNWGLMSAFIPQKQSQCSICLSSGHAWISERGRFGQRALNRSIVSFSFEAVDWISIKIQECIYIVKTTKLKKTRNSKFKRIRKSRKVIRRDSPKTPVQMDSFIYLAIELFIHCSPSSLPPRTFLTC